MKSYIFNRVQEEIEIIDEKISLYTDPLLKSLRFKNYSSLIQCLSTQKTFKTSYSQLHAYCLKQTEGNSMGLDEITKEINFQKGELYHCLNKSYIMSETSDINEKIVMEVDNCLNRFKTSIFAHFKTN